MIKKLLSPLLLGVCYISSSLQALSTDAPEAVVLDFQHKLVLFEKNAHKQMTPSSMTKVLTSYLIFEALEQKLYDLESKFEVSKEAWAKGGSRMFLNHQSKVSIHELLQGILVSSGNDACITAAEGLYGSEAAFAEVMSKRAKALGAVNSHFLNATGWPDKGHYSTAFDIALISRELIARFPSYYKRYFSQTHYTYNNIKQYNQNTLLRENFGVDGLKTGRTSRGAYGLASSVVNRRSRFITVVNGMPDQKSRISESRKLLKWAIANFETIPVLSGSQSFKLPLLAGDQSFFHAQLQKDALLTVNREAPRFTAEIALSKQEAPIQKGELVGEIVLKQDYGVVKFPIYATEAIKKAGWMRAAWNRFKGMFIKPEALTPLKDLQSQLEENLKHLKFNAS